MPKLRHAFVSSKSDGNDSSLVKPSDWNAALKIAESDGTPSEYDAVIRHVITDDFTIYVDGSRPNDSGDGLTPSTAKKTIQAGVNLAASYASAPPESNANPNLGPFVIVQVADGTYSEEVNLPAVYPAYWSGHHVFGNSDLTSVIMDSPTGSNFYTENPGWAIAGFWFKNSTADANASAIYADNNASINAGSTFLDGGTGNRYDEFLNGYHLYARSGAQIVEYWNTIISGGARAHWRVRDGGVIQGANGAEINFDTPNLDFSEAFAVAGSWGGIDASGVTYTGDSGSVTGRKAWVYGTGTVSTIDAVGGTAGSLPGDEPAVIENTSSVDVGVSGSWTPTVDGEDVSITSATYTARPASYFRFGQLVYFSAQIQINTITIGSGSGALVVRGLPFDFDADDTLPGLIQAGISGVSWGAGATQLIGYGAASDNYVYFQSFQSAGAAALVDISALGAGDLIQMTGIYRAKLP